jgi:Ser/Thr protein kinase RdoA (MazF antagonist)
MPEQEEKLTGGNTAESVVRLGSTVRKPVTKATPAVHAFLNHLRAAGYSGSPAALGIDAQGRQILEFIPGTPWNGGPPRTRNDLRRVGGLIRALHHAAVTFQAPALAQWDASSVPDEYEILCHNDLAPWNLVCGPERWAFIDWDNAAPGTCLWDLAWAALSFPPFEPGCDLPVAASAMYALLDGYGLETSHYGALLGLMVTRAQAEYELLVKGAEAGRQPWSKLYTEGHHQYWGPVSDYIDRHTPALHRMLIERNSRSA